MTNLTLHEIASAVRGRRRDMGLSQAELAFRVGVSRRWVQSVEDETASGAGIASILRLLDALGLRIDFVDDRSGEPTSSEVVNLDQLIADHRS